MLTTINGAPLSRLCFGAMQFGRGADRPAAESMFADCCAAGINTFDTAHGYNDGLSETWLGQMVAPKRDSLFFSTKLAATGGAGFSNIMDQFRISQDRHGLDTVDLLYLHRWDPDTCLEETFRALTTLHSAGRVRYVGLSNFAAWQVMKAVSVASGFGLRIAAIQPMYNLVKRQVEIEILPMARDQGIAVFPYSPLGGGLLTGKYRNGGEGRLSSDQIYAARYGAGWMHHTASALADLAQENGFAPATLAVAWVAQNRDVKAPIISAKSSEQLKPSLRAVNIQLDDDLYHRITGLSKKPASATDRSEEIT